MLQTVLRNKKGVTLVEVLISLVILLVVFMGLIQASLLSIENNVTTALRDEAVRLATETVAALKTGPFDDLNRDGIIPDAPPLPPTPFFTMSSTGSAAEQGNASRLGINTVRASRNISSNYVVRVTVDNVFDNDNKQVTVRVEWAWKERTFVGGNPNRYDVTALLRRT
jgi:prepilin-type N-terminal cleavage/methylation domain-containing protein